MKKFILVDHSIVKVGGHYLEYAQNVLSEAKKEYEIWIATNQKLESREGLESYHVIPAYPYDIWGKAPSDKKKSHLKAIKSKVTDQWGQVATKLRYLVTFSAVGYGIKGLRTYNGRVFLHKSLVKNGLLVAGGFLAGMVLLLPYILLKLLRFGWRLVKKCGEKLGINKAIAMFKRVFTKEKAKKLLTEAEVIKGFEKATLKVLQKAEIEEGDIIFVPTLSVLDLTAIHNVMEKNPRASRCSWHLLFRRNLFEGREPEYMRQIEAKTDLQEQLAYFAGCENVFFYTDTEALTIQYNRVSQVKFITMPIPINPDFQAEETGATDGIYTITYAGDARSEKGYQYIPDVAEKLHLLLEEGELRFELQSNFTFKSSKDDAAVVVARNRLEEMDEKQVLLHKKPMDSNTYCDMVRRASLGLLLYDRENYYARSSGALVECLAGGIPVLVPSASWLSDQIMPSIVAYQLQLAKTMQEHQVQPINHPLWLPFAYFNSFIDFMIQLQCGKQMDNEVESRLSGILKRYATFSPKETSEIYQVYKSKPPLEKVDYLANLLFGATAAVHDVKDEISLYGSSMTKAQWVQFDGAAKAVHVRFSLDDRTEIGVYVRTKCTFFDEYCHQIQTDMVENGKLEAVQGNCSALFRIPEGARAMLVELSCPRSMAPALCREFSLALWDCCDFPLTAVGSVYVETDEISDWILEQYRYRKHYRETAGLLRTQWNTLHNSKSLVETIKESVKTSGGLK